MDKNKLNVLREIGYRVHTTCGLCTHADISSDGWGTCGLHHYDHLKHVGQPRSLSINQFGSCPKWERSWKVDTMKHFEEFFEEKTYDVSERQRQKQESRDKDESDLKAGAKSAEQLRSENGHFGVKGRVKKWK